MKTTPFTVLAVILWAFAGIAAAQQTPAPPSVSPPISADEVAGSRDGDVLLIDIRSNVEWECIRIPGARNLPAESLRRANLLELREKGATRPKLVFYGNGDFADREAVAAANAAKGMGFTETYVLKGGIARWKVAMPDRTLLFGQPADSETGRVRGVTEDELRQVMIPKDAWLEAARGGKFTVLDVRRPDQRLGRNVLPAGHTTLTPDDLVRSYRRNALPLSMVLLADYDESMVPWLVYYLRAFGVQKYSFLKGGSKALETPPPATPAPPLVAPPPSRPLDPQTIIIDLPNKKP